jgi:dihydrofolate synthase/folylpolyglutamate synthase
MNYQEALDYIHSVTWMGSRPGLSRTRELTERIGRPQDRLRFIHVAGTNGKGSTSAMTAAILTAAGYRVGLYTSPYVLRFNERMRVDGQDIPDGELAEVTAFVKPHADAMTDPPTEFELITAIALEWFARRRCDIVVLEVGMGGRLDSTNIIDAETVAASVITGIALDHTAFLGNTPEAIAAEKAGIIKSGVPVIFGGMHAPIGEDSGSTLHTVDPAVCATVIRAKADEMGAPYVETDHAKLTRAHADLRGADFDFGALTNLHISLAGLYQPYNAATVLTLIEVLRNTGMDIPDEAIRSGLASVRWPARFEILSESPLVIADGGHNPEGIDAAIASVKRYFGDERIYLVTGVMADKDYARMIARMSEVAERVFTVRPANDRALDPMRYAELFREAGIPATGHGTVADGVHAAMKAARENGKALLCLGSLYMYGEVREAVRDAESFVT